MSNHLRALSLPVQPLLPLDTYSTTFAHHDRSQKTADEERSAVA